MVNAGDLLDILVMMITLVLILLVIHTMKKMVNNIEWSTSALLVYEFCLTNGGYDVSTL